MRVVTMVLLSASYYILLIGALIIAFFSTHFFWLAYLNSFVLFIMFIIILWSIPLHLNWSRNLYGFLMKRITGFIFFSISIYAVSYYQIGIQDASGQINKSFLNAMYFSITTWTTLGYGDFSPVSKLRLLTSLEALTGLLSIPLMASMMWLFCRDRLWPKSLEESQKEKEKFEIQLDSATGVWKEIENAKIETEKTERKNKFRLNICKNCNNKDIEIEKFYEIMGKVTPLSQFSVFCSCGTRTKGYISAYRAVWAWNKKNKKGNKKKDSSVLK